MTKDLILSELQRVAKELNADSLSMATFARHGTISVSQVCQLFGSWNRAVQEAGLKPYPSRKRTGTGKRSFKSDHAEEDLLREIIRLTRHLGREPSEADMNKLGLVTSFPYLRRWGSFAKAREEAYGKFGNPLA